MANLDLCPQCRGKLVPVGERTGGFSGKKAVLGAVVAGPVGVAAGALGKQLVTLQCVKCGYTVETDEKTAQEAVEFGEAFEQYCQMQDRLHNRDFPFPDLIHKYGYSQTEFKKKGLLNRDQEREKIGIDFAALERQVQEAVAEVKRSNQAKRAAFEQEREAALEQLRQKKKDAEDRLSKLGFFKFSEKKAAQAEIADLEQKLDTVSRRQGGPYEDPKARAAEIRSEMVERCRVLAVGALEEYAPEEYREFLFRIYNVLTDEPMTAEEILKKLHTDVMTPLQLSMRMGYTSNPFVTEDSKELKNMWFFGADTPHMRGWVERYKQMHEKELKEQRLEELGSLVEEALAEMERAVEEGGDAFDQAYEKVQKLREERDQLWNEVYGQKRR